MSLLTTDPARSKGGLSANPKLRNVASVAPTQNRRNTKYSATAPIASHSAPTRRIESNPSPGVTRLTSAVTT